MHCEKKIEKVGNNFVTVSFFGDAKRENSSRLTPDVFFQELETDIAKIVGAFYGELYKDERMAKRIHPEEKHKREKERTLRFYKKRTFHFSHKLGDIKIKITKNKFWVHRNSTRFLDIKFTLFFNPKQGEKFPSAQDFETFWRIVVHRTFY